MEGFGWLAHRGSGNRTTGVRENARLRERIGQIVERHRRKHVGIAVGVLSDGGVETLVRGRAKADAIFEIGSITRVARARVAL